MNNWFIPHRETHKKAHLVSWHGFLIWILIFILLQVSFNVYGNLRPGVMGVNSNIDQKVLIDLTNKERVKAGLPPLTENSSLDSAAAAKAANMFQEDYWAHFAPSGKSPWDFINGSGYKYAYAGENLAKNFYGSQEVVSAWMASPDHKDNIVNSKYQEIGIAVVDGVLNGQKTTLVVQMFGTSKSASVIADAPSTLAGESSSNPQLLVLAKQESARAIIDPYQIFKIFGFAILAFVAGLLVMDFIILKKRGVARAASHHFANLSFLAVGAISVISSSPGSIL